MSADSPVVQLSWSLGRVLPTAGLGRITKTMLRLAMLLSHNHALHDTFMNNRPKDLRANCCETHGSAVCRRLFLLFFFKSGYYQPLSTRPAVVLMSAETRGTVGRVVRRSSLNKNFKVDRFWTWRLRRLQQQHPQSLLQYFWNIKDRLSAGSLWRWAIIVSFFSEGCFSEVVSEFSE